MIITCWPPQEPLAFEGRNVAARKVQGQDYLLTYADMTPTCFGLQITDSCDDSDNCFESDYVGLNVDNEFNGMVVTYSNIRADGSFVRTKRPTLTVHAL